MGNKKDSEPGLDPDQPIKSGQKVDHIVSTADWDAIDDSNALAEFGIEEEPVAVSEPEVNSFADLDAVEEFGVDDNTFSHSEIKNRQQAQAVSREATLIEKGSEIIAQRIAEEIKQYQESGRIISLENPEKGFILKKFKKLNEMRSAILRGLSLEQYRERLQNIAEGLLDQDPKKQLCQLME